MTGVDDTTDKPGDALDRALAAVPRRIEPDPALWTRIAAEIAVAPQAGSHIKRNVVELQAKLRVSDSSQGVAAHSTSRTRWLQMAAAVLLVVASSLTTWIIVQRSMSQEMAQVARSASAETVRQMQPVLTAMPVSFGANELGSGYQQARAQLIAEFDRRIASLSPVTRSKVERDLADLRRAAGEISATLGQHPADPLLQQLLLSAYQSELALLGSVNDLTAPSVVGADL